MDIISSGAQAATLNTPHLLYQTTDAGVYSLMVDTSQLALGDVLELSVDVAFASGGTRRQTYAVTYAHTQSDPGKISVPVVAPFGAAFYLNQTAGTARSFDWCVVLT